MKKLVRDKVVSMTDKGDLVGVYFEGDDGSEVILECPPKEANKLIKIWNKYVKK